MEEDGPKCRQIDRKRLKECMKRDKGSPKVKRWILVTLAVFEKNECKFLRDNHRISGRLNRKKGTLVSVFVGYVLLF